MMVAKSSRGDEWLSVRHHHETPAKTKAAVRVVVMVASKPLQENQSPVSLFTNYLHHHHHHYWVIGALQAAASVVTSVVTKARMVAA